MKSWGKTLGLGLTAAIVICLAARAQLNSFTQTSPPPPPDSIVSAVADEKGLPLVPPGEVPRFGTFWTFFPGAGSGITPPFPCLCNSNLPVYEIAEGQFLVDGSSSVQAEWNTTQASRVSVRSSVADTVTAQANALINLVDWLQGIEQDRQLRLLARAAGMDVPLPGDDGFGGGTNGYGASYAAQIFTTNDLWLQITGTSNGNSGTTITSYLTIHTPWNVTNGVYDLFATTNLAPSSWRWVMRCDPGQTNLIVTNLTTPQEFFILGLTNDTDGGGLTDAYEKLVTKTDPNNANDDRLTPLVGIQTTDAVAVEQNSANTASFVVSRLGGYMGQPLTVTLGISGTATAGPDYTLAPGSVTGTNFSVTIPTGQTSVTVTLAAVNDSLIEGTETATLTLLNYSGWTNDLAHSSVTAWILEDYTKIYTSNADFNLGVLSGLEAVNDQLQFKTNLPAQFPFINVACSARGTVARINTTNGMIVGEYRTAPEDVPIASNPSRTTVDEYGNVWVANRDDTYAINATNYGSITRIGLIMGGTRYAKTNGIYVADPHGQYVSLTNVTYNTCIDRDGDGYIRTSQGLGDILPWSDYYYYEGIDLEGGVSTAEDEAITEYTRVPCTGTRTIAVDKFNDIWVGGNGIQIHLKVNGLTGSVVPNSAFSPSAGGYGGVIDGSGNLWSSLNGSVVWMTPPTNPAVPNNNWQVIASGTSSYGIAVDPMYPWVWQTTGYGDVFRWHTNGTPETNIVDGSTILYPHGFSASQGLTVDGNGHVWVAHSAIGKTTSTDVGHLDTNGVWLGNVLLRLSGLRAEYFANTNCDGTPVFVRADGPVDFYETNGWPVAPTPTNAFSVKWSGVLLPRVEGDHVLTVSADAGAAFRLTVNGNPVIDNWSSPAANAVTLSDTNNYSTNQIYSLVLEYAEFSHHANIRLAWLEPGSASNVVIPRSQLKGPDLGMHPTGVSVDSFGKIWAANLDTSDAMRIDPNAGEVVVINGVTNHVGEVDMVVSLGSGANPYNYSDMTGFNNRVVNSGLKPLKGYWNVIDDSGVAGQAWKSVSWNALATNGSAVEVYVRASDDRTALADEPFVSAANGVTLTGVKGRFIEARLALMRQNATNQPLVYDLTLHGISSSFDGNAYLGYISAVETTDAVFTPTGLVGAGPMSYQWFIQYPWMNPWNLTMLLGETNSSLVISNVDSWLNGANGTWVSEHVTDATGEELWLGPAELYVQPLTNNIPGSGQLGPAQRYPMTINVFGQSTNLASVIVTLASLSHGHSADLDILLVSPSGTNIMLMSHAGGTYGLSDATLVFIQSGSLPPSSSAIPSGQTSYYEPRNYGSITNMPSVGSDPPPSGPYSTNLYDLIGTSPNGIWKLYIYDDHSGVVGVGQLHDSWQLNFTFQ